MKWILLSAALLLGSILPTQQVTYEEKEAYFQKLLHIQQKMDDRVHIIRKIAQKTITNSQSLKGQYDLQKTVLNEGIRTERDQLELTLQQTLIPLKENYWSCKNLSNSEKQLIAAKIKDLKGKTDSINKQIQGEKDCTRNIELKSQLRFLTLHIQSLENELSNTCQPPRKDDKFINNLDTSKDWIYGSLPVKDYEKNIDDLQQKYNLIKCDQDKPFIINNQCSACSKSQEKFSLSENKCIQQCPTGTVYLKLNHNCVDPTKKVFVPQSLSNVDGSKNPYIWGPISQQQYKDQIQQLKNNNVPVEECPADKPFNENGERCTSCSSGQVFNVGTRECTSCKGEEKYVQRIHQCKQIYKKPNYDAGKNWIAVNGDSKPVDDKLKQLQNQNYPVQQCPADKPFPSKDLTSCVSCNKNYNLNTGSCEQCNKYFAVTVGQHECKYVSKSCGSDEFWNGEKCIKCVKPGVYNNNVRNCVCNEPLKYDSESGECLAGASNQKNPNPTNANNFVGSAPVVSKFLENCSDSRPFYDEKSKECIECSLPSKYFNYDTSNCQQCDKPLQFNIDQKKCVQPLTIFNSNISPNTNNYCCGQPVNVQGKQNCPADRPFFDGYHCVSCSKPQYFDFKDKQCKSCPSEKDFSTTLKTCIDSALLKPKIVSNLPNGVNNYYGTIPSDRPDSQGQQVTKCPQDKPFSNGKQCIKCEQPRYFNFQSGQCEMCKDGYSFSSDSRQCLRNTLVGKEIYNSNMVNAENFVGKVPEYKTQYPECPTDRRYFNGQECQRCELPYFWNFDKNDCRECDKGLYFQKQARQCFYESGQQKYKTNLDASKKIYYNGNFDDVKRQLEGSGKTGCPGDRPFFDKSTNECISCGGGSDIFNFVKNRCMRCSDGTHFNQEYHICFQNGVQPTIQRMVMNSVSWI